MKAAIYEWIRNIVFYQLLISIVMNLLPDDVYKKYIRFFLGMLFLVIVMQPVFHVLDLSENMDISYYKKQWENELEENKLELDVREWQKSDGEMEDPENRNEEG